MGGEALIKFRSDPEHILQILCRIYRQSCGRYREGEK